MFAQYEIDNLRENHKEAVQKYIDEPKKWVAVNLHYLAIMDVLIDQQKSTHIDDYIYYIIPREMK